MHSYMVFLGTSRSGKMSLLLSILNHRKLYKKAFHTIFVGWKDIVDRMLDFNLFFTRRGRDDRL